MLEDLEPIKQIRSCKIRTLKESLEHSDQVLLEGYLADTNWTAHILAKALAAKGLKVDHRQITQHRDKMCSCGDVVK